VRCVRAVTRPGTGLCILYCKAIMAGGRISELSNRQRRLLKQVLARQVNPARMGARQTGPAGAPPETGPGTIESVSATRSGSLALAAPIPPIARDAQIPLSLAQQRLWFLDRLQPGSSIYNIPAIMRLKGPLDLSILEQSFNELVRRHESLRTTFAEVEGQGIQVIKPELKIKLSSVDLCNVPDSERETRACQLIDEEAERPFDLESGPLLRVTVLRLALEEHIQIIVVHHIVSDAWSFAVLFRDVSAFYHAISAGREPALPDLSIQCADFANWQRQRMEGGLLQSKLAYWREKLAGMDGVLELPGDYARPPTKSFRGAAEAFVMPVDLHDRLRLLSREHNVTLFTTLLAVFEVLLNRYTSKDEFAVGTAVAGRNRAEVEELIGFFVNTVVLRTDLSGDPTFSELLARVEQVKLEAHSHQEVPFERIVEELRPERDLSRPPLVQVMFNFVSVPSRGAGFSGVKATLLEPATRTAKFDLTLDIWKRQDRFRVKFDYSTDLFKSSTIRRMLDHYRILLEGVVQDADQKISRLPLLTAAEKHQLLVEWNDTKADYPRERCVHGLFEEQVERTPEAVAVSLEDQRLSYRELNRRANQLAHQLRDLGVGTEVVVGICAERSLEMIVGLLGILKAGGAYLPLDPENPQERLAFMIEDAGAQLLLTQKRFVERLPRKQAQLLCLDALPESDGGENTENPDGGAQAENSAYVIYTSGSTGLPKGAAIRHRSLVNYSYWVNRCLVSQDVDCFPLIGSLSFDAHLKQIFAPLVRGSDVWILPPGIEIQPPMLIKALCERTKVGLNGVVSLWKALLPEIGPSERTRLRRSLSAVLVGGEPLTAEVINRSLELFPDLQVWNLYGPSEATSNSTCTRLRRGDAVTIGRPIANAQIYILDRYLHSVPIGVFGDLHIGGDGLARGYLNQPELTAEKFIPNPFGDEPGARLYKTGDLARYLPDGNIEFLGRKDGQVKIRGVRIELGEIEAVLAKHPSVNEAAVVVNEHETAGQRLVAYLASGSQQQLQTAELREFLKTKLPGYMLPSHFVFLDALPLTPIGKVDRAGLPPPDLAHVERDEYFLAPSTAMEAKLAEVWEHVLGIDQAGVRDNFFELGGHSLLSIEVISKLERQTGLRINPGEMVVQNLGQLAAAYQEWVDHHPSATPGPVRKAFHRAWKAFVER